MMIDDRWCDDWWVCGLVRQLVSKCRAAQRASSYGWRRLLWAPRGRRRTLASWRKKPPATMHSPRSLACREAMIPPHSSDGIATVSAEYVYAAELSGCICPHTVRHTVTWSGAHRPMGTSMALRAAEARDGGAVQVRRWPSSSPAVVVSQTRVRSRAAECFVSIAEQNGGDQHGYKEPAPI